VHKGYNFSTSSSLLAIFCFVDSDDSSGWEMASHCGLICVYEHSVIFICVHFSFFTVSQILYLCNMFWNQEVWDFQFCSFKKISEAICSSFWYINFRIYLYYLCKNIIEILIKITLTLYLTLDWMVEFCWLYCPL
jgi:hypothetical protein